MICNRSVDTGLGFAVGGGGGGTGTVTSVAMTVPSILAVGGSPVTTAGTLALTLQPQLQNRVFASPIGSSGVPTFRSIVAEDLNPTYSNGQVLQTNGAGVLSWVTPSGSGTVTSVAMTVPSILAVSGSPITTSGTLALSLVSQSPNHVFASPPGASGLPTFRNLVAEHLNPTYTNGQVLQTNGSGVLSWVNQNAGTVTSVAMTVPSIFSVSGSPITTTGTLAVSLVSQSPNHVFASPPGASGLPTFRNLVAEHLNPTYTNGQVLQTNGSGVLSWVTPTGGSPSLPLNSIQFNNAGAFGGSSQFTFVNNGSQLLNITNSTNSTSLVVFNTKTGGTVDTAIIGIGNNRGIIGDSIANGGIGVFAVGNVSSTVQTIGLCVESSQTDATLRTTPLVKIYDQTTYNNNSYLLRVHGNSAEVVSMWGNGRTGFRFNTPPVNGIIEMPWLSGDTLPTLFVGSINSNVTSLQVISGFGTGIFSASINNIGINGYSQNNVAIVGSSSVSHAIKGNASNSFVAGVYGSNNSTNGYGVLAESNGDNTVAFAIQQITSGTRSNDLTQINVLSQAGTYNVLHVQNNGLSLSYLRLNQSGILSIRTGLDTTNKVTDVGGQFFTSTSDASNSGTVETDLTAVITPGNILGNDGDRLEIEASFTTAANTNTKNIRLYFGATRIIDVTCANGGTASSVVVNATIIRVNSTTQRCYATSSADVAPSLSNANYTTASEILSGAVTTKFTGQGSASSDITQRTMSIKWFPKGQG